MSSNFDHGDVGQVYPHDKAGLADGAMTPTQRSGGSVSGRMLLAVTFGAFVGYLLSFVIAVASEEIVERVEKFHDRRHQLGIYVEDPE